jgi:hypothetical protein
MMGPQVTEKVLMGFKLRARDALGGAWYTLQAQHRFLAASE